MVRVHKARVMDQSGLIEAGWHDTSHTALVSAAASTAIVTPLRQVRKRTQEAADRFVLAEMFSSSNRTFVRCALVVLDVLLPPATGGG